MRPGAPGAACPLICVGGFGHLQHDSPTPTSPHFLFYNNTLNRNANSGVFLFSAKIQKKAFNPLHERITAKPKKRQISLKKIQEQRSRGLLLLFTSYSLRFQNYTLQLFKNREMLIGVVHLSVTLLL